MEFNDEGVFGNEGFDDFMTAGYIRCRCESNLSPNFVVFRQRFLSLPYVVISYSFITTCFITLFDSYAE
jgi:hypothetical protein